MPAKKDAEYWRNYRAKKGKDEDAPAEATPIEGVQHKPHERRVDRVPALEARIAELEEEVRRLKQELARRPMASATASLTVANEPQSIDARLARQRAERANWAAIQDKLVSKRSKG